jgi:hypothetical protein
MVYHVPDQVLEEHDRLVYLFHRLHGARCIFDTFDHQLKGDIYESVVLGFLAVLGIDTGNFYFFEAPNYTSKLSGFIKISQMLALGAAVHAVESGKVGNPLDPFAVAQGTVLCSVGSGSLRSFERTVSRSK